MNFKTIQGKKSLKDRILIWVCKCGREYWIPFLDIGKCARLLAQVERNNYFNGKREGKVQEFLRLCTTLNTEGRPVYTLRECCQLADLPEPEKYDYSDIPYEP